MTRPLAVAASCALLSSCFVFKVPIETAGTVVTSSAKIAEKTATTGVEVAGKAAGAVIDGKLPGAEKSVWTAFR